MVAVMLVTSCTDAVAVALMKLEVLVITRSVAFTGKAKDVEVETATGLVVDVLSVTLVA